MLFIWPYYDGNAHYDELRWSIRSVQKFFQGEVECLIVGDCPKWWNGQHIGVKRRTDKGNFKEGLHDALTKWYRGLKVAYDDQVVWMMDDIFFIKPVSLEDLSVPRASAHLSESYKTGFQSAKSRTYLALKELNKPTWNYSTHLPHLVNRQKAIDLFEEHKIIDRSLIWESFYQNMVATSKPKPYTNFFYYALKAMNDVQIRVVTSKVSIINTGKNAWNEAMRRFLYKLLPDAHPFEIGEFKPPRAALRGKDEGQYTAHGKGWRSPNGKAPEYEYLDFIKMLIALNKPDTIIETGMGRGHVTKLLPGTSKLMIYESDAKFRAKPPVCERFVSKNPTPSAYEMAQADLVLLDSTFDYRKKEIALWHSVGKPGSTMLCHDVSDRHAANKIHTQLYNYIMQLGIPGAQLFNPRGGFIATKSNKI